MPTIWETIRERFDREAQKLAFAFVPPEHIRDAPLAHEPLIAGKHYFRLWLSEMYLHKDREWGKTWHPAVHTLVEFQFGNQKLEVPYLAGANKLKDIDKNLDKSVALNYPLTALMPYNGGVVEVTAAMLAMQGDDFVKRFIGVVGDFASLLVVPQLSTAIGMIGPVARGIEELIGATDGSFHLGLHLGLTGSEGTGSNKLQPGYFVVIRMPQNEIQANNLWVDGDRLLSGDTMQGAQPFKNCDYILFKIDSMTERDDFESLTYIQEPFKKALSNLLDLNQPEQAEAELRRAILAAYGSSDLTRLDRARVAASLKQQFQQVKDSGLGAVSVDEGSNLKEIMLRADPPDVFSAGEQPELETLLK